MQDCIDLHGRTIAQGLHFVPGPDACTLCICDSGSPKWCKAVLCSPPQDCKSFRVGNSCCEFICLDDTLVKGDGEHDFNADLGIRLIATATIAILSLSLLFFLIHRLRQRKIRGRQNRELSCEEDRSLGSIGYIGGSLAFLGEGHYDDSGHGQFPLWKPAGYFTRGEAPPPYEEAVAAARAEAALQHCRINPAPGPSVISVVTQSSHHRTIPANLATSAALILPPPPIPELPEEPSGVHPAVTPSHGGQPHHAGPSGPITLQPGGITHHVGAVQLAHHGQTSVHHVGQASNAPGHHPHTLPSQAQPSNNHPTNTTPHSNNTGDTDVRPRRNPQISTIPSAAVPTPLAVVSANSEEAEDYRSECENCLMSANQRAGCESEYCADLRTMTLQRKNGQYDEQQPMTNFYRTSLTLPTQVSKHHTRILGPNGGVANSGCAREKWFSSMPETSSSDED